MAYHQKFSQLINKSSAVNKWLRLVSVTVSLHSVNWFSWRIFIQVSLAAQGRIRVEVYFTLSKIILFHNPFQMSYWLREPSSHSEALTYSSGIQTPVSQESRGRMTTSGKCRELPADGMPMLTIDIYSFCVLEASLVYFHQKILYGPRIQKY